MQSLTIEQIIKNNEKALIFCQLSIFIAFIFVVLKLLQIKVAVFSFFQSKRKRNQIIKNFNERNELIIIIIVYALAAVELNLQKKC